MFQETIIEFMKSLDLQPLQYMAAMRVAISVCGTKDAICMIKRFCNINGNDSTVGFSDNQWRRLRGRVKRKLTQIGVPEIIINIVLENVWPISFEIYKWILYHKENTSIGSSMSFCWTSQATIDYQKTAEILVKNEALDIRKRYKLACFYCLDTEVRFLWEQMSLSEKRSFFIRGNLKESKLDPIVLYWSYYIQEVPISYWRSKALNHTRLFIYAVQNGYLNATKFFFGKLQPSLRKRMILNCFYTHLFYVDYSKNIVKDLSAVACFLVCQLPSDYWEITLSTKLGLVFHYFLRWPMQKHFMTVVNRLRRHLNEKLYLELLEGIFAKILGDFKDHDYKELFMEFWHECPEGSKTYVRTQLFGYKIFMKFVQKHFGFVFIENSFAIKAKFRAIVLQGEISEDIAEKENVEFFKFLVRERVTTKSSIDRFSNPTNLFIHSIHDGVDEFFSLPLGELKYLIDGILGKE